MGRNGVTEYKICPPLSLVLQGPHSTAYFWGCEKCSNAKECSNYCTISLIQHTSKVMLKILQDITLPTKVCLVQAMVFPVVMYGCESWTIKKAERWRIDAFELWCWRRLLRVPWTARRSNQSILKEINPAFSLEGLMLKLKLQYFGHLTHLKMLTHLKRPWCWERVKAGGEGTTEDEMVAWHHWLNGHEFG